MIPAMHQHDPKSLDKLMGNSSTLNFLLKKANALLQIESILNELLPDEFKEQLKTISYDGETLVVAAKSAEWAMKIRFGAPDLIKQLKRHPQFAGLRKITPKLTKN